MDLLPEVSAFCSVRIYVVYRSAELLRSFARKGKTSGSLTICRRSNRGEVWMYKVIGRWCYSTQRRSAALPWTAIYIKLVAAFDMNSNMSNAALLRENTCTSKQKAFAETMCAGWIRVWIETYERNVTMQYRRSKNEHFVRWIILGVRVNASCGNKSKRIAVSFEAVTQLGLSIGECDWRFNHTA